MPMFKYNPVNANRGRYKKMLEDRGRELCHYEEYDSHQPNGREVVTLIAWLLERASPDCSLVDGEEDGGPVTVARTTWEPYSQETLYDAQAYLDNNPQQPDEGIAMDNPPHYYHKQNHMADAARYLVKGYVGKGPLGIVVDDPLKEPDADAAG